MKGMYLTMVALLIGSVTLQAQDVSKEKNGKEAERLMQESLDRQTRQLSERLMQESLDRQTRQLSERLMLDDKTTAQFEKVYKDYQTELQNLNVKSQKKALTDEQIEAAMKDGWNRTKKTAEIQEKYYKEFRKFLTVKQAQIVFDNDYPRLALKIVS